MNDEDQQQPPGQQPAHTREPMTAERLAHTREPMTAERLAAIRERAEAAPCWTSAA